MIASNTAVLVTLVRHFRSKCFITIEQPKGSFMFKMSYFRLLLCQTPFFLVLTYLGLWGLDILKGTHLWTTMEILGLSWAWLDHAVLYNYI